MRTTDLDKVLENHRLFSWGEVITDYEVGPYQIIEYYPWKTEGVEVRVGKPDYNDRAYHGYINGEDVRRSYSSLDAALAGLIAYRQDGSNSQAGTYFIKMIKGD